MNNPRQLNLLDASDEPGADGPYLDAVIKETLRLYPAAPIVVRKLLEPMTLGGHEVPAGTRVAACVQLVHRDPTICPDPLAHFRQQTREPPVRRRGPRRDP